MYVYVCIYICEYICVFVYIYAYNYICDEIDLCHSGRIRGQILPTQIRHSNTRSTSLKLIYIILSIYKSKIKCFEYFYSCIK